MHRLVISAPFGNYVRPRGATPTLGTFTLEGRPGRAWRVLRTVRRVRRLGAWVNRIGLRNPGIDWLSRRVARGREDLSGAIVSVHGFDDGQWAALVERVRELGAMAVEMNMSCPNVGEAAWESGVFEGAMATWGDGERVIVKLPPVRYEAMARAALASGVRAFHCCNTLPVPGGGMSGKPLMPLSLRCIGDVRAMAGDERLVVIGGGGITGEPDIDEYARAGATHVALGTRVMHPKHLWSDAGVRGLIEHAERRLGDQNPGPVPGGSPDRRARRGEEEAPTGRG